MEIEINLETKRPAKLVGTVQELAEMPEDKIKQVMETVQKIQNGFGNIAVQTVASASGGFPALSIQTNSITDALNALVQTEWFSSPRTMTEIYECLQTNALLCPKGQLADRLVKMTRRGVFRRIPSPEGYKYGRGLKSSSPA